MEGFELSIVINRPIEEVFGFLTNLENDLKWRSEWVDASNTSRGSLGVGATFRSWLKDPNGVQGYRIRAEPECGVENRVRTSPNDILEKI
jgi:uncharacterized protein YndB with AHSA1/START domain